MASRRLTSNERSKIQRAGALRRWQRSIGLSQTTLRQLDGLIASDGSIRRYWHQGSFSLSGKYQEWVDHVATLLRTAGVELKQGHHKTGHAYLRTRTYGVFGDLGKRWYSKGRKGIPRGLHL